MIITFKIGGLIQRKKVKDVKRAYRVYTPDIHLFILAQY